MIDRVLILSEAESDVLRYALDRMGELIQPDQEAAEAVRAMLDTDPLDGWQPGPWWQVIDTDIEASETDPDQAWRKALWCETSDEADARRHMEKGQAKGRNLRIQHHWRRGLNVWLTDEENSRAMIIWRARG